MSPVQQRGLALWAALLSAVVCLAFLPLSRLASVLVLLAMIGVIVAFWYIARPRAELDVNLRLDDLPETTYRQPVVLVCGDMPLTWPPCLSTARPFTVARSSRKGMISVLWKIRVTSSQSFRL